MSNSEDYGRIKIVVPATGAGGIILNENFEAINDALDELSGVTTGASGVSGYSGISGASGVGQSGFSGYSGQSGKSGISGSSGVSGTSGAQGQSGSSGVSGTSGRSGYSGQSGQSGASGVGISGTSGTSGYSGYSGKSGTSGANGSDGASGISGVSGQNGVSGTSGRSGTSGQSGVSGVSGISGGTGASGASGYSGQTGSGGVSGTSGRSGASGVSGYSGQSGASGVGISGASGASGQSGQSGSSGRSGYSGRSGTSGRSGFSGVSGLSGVSGRAGGKPCCVYYDVVVSGDPLISGTHTAILSPTGNQYRYLIDSSTNPLVTQFTFQDLGSAWWIEITGTDEDGSSAYIRYVTANQLSQCPPVEISTFSQTVASFDRPLATTTDSFTDFGTTAGDVYQVFTADYASFFQFRIGVSFEPDDQGQSTVTWKLMTAPGGTPTTQLDSGTAEIRNTDGNLIVAPITLTVGDQYAIVLNQQTPDDTNYYTWATDSVSGDKQITISYHNVAATIESITNCYTGVSGTSGYSGPSGSSGYSGKSGVGVSGYSGLSGVGASGVSGRSGVSGTSGQSGQSGASGVSGASGYSGKSGVSGISGYSGTNGTSGYSGVSGYSGDNPGSSGVSGVSGSSGRSGRSGVSGVSGVSGLRSCCFTYVAAIDGTAGGTYDGSYSFYYDGVSLNTWSTISPFPGTLSLSGGQWIISIDEGNWTAETYPDLYICPPATAWTVSDGTLLVSDCSSVGADGASGSSGYSGYSGKSGVSGVSGANGSSGVSGTSGYSGPTGSTGSAGASGTSGVSGYSGPAGSTGSAGSSGVSGTSGYSGPTGSTGSTGASGTSGYSGYSGRSGVSGSSGSSGASGISGASGTPGLRPCCTYYEIETSGEPRTDGIHTSKKSSSAGVYTYFLDSTTGPAEVIIAGFAVGGSYWQLEVRASSADFTVWEYWRTEDFRSGCPPTDLEEWVPYQAGATQYIATSTDSTTDFGTTAGDVYQVFTADYATLFGFAVFVNFSPDDQGQSNITWGLYATSGGSPTGGALQSGNFDLRSTNSVGFLGQALTPGLDYAIVLNQTSPDDTNFYNWDTASGSGKKRLEISYSGTSITLESVTNCYTGGGGGEGGGDGASGVSGYSGAQGTAGVSGVSGASGYSGYSGRSGVSGTSGATGGAGASGTSGVSGYSGPTGGNGSAGASGTSGYSGYSGVGVSGVSGFSGAGTTASGQQVLEILEVCPPATLFPQLNVFAGGSSPAERLYVWQFDSGTIEYLDFKVRLSEKYAGGGITLKLGYSSTQTSGAAVWGAALRRVADDAEDLDTSQTYDFNDVTSTTASAVGEVAYASITFTNGSDMDSVAAGEYAILRIRRNASSGSDNLTGDASLHFISGRET